MSEQIKGIANDGTEFTAESDAVIAYREQYPDVTLEAAIGSVVGIYNEQTATVEETSDVPSTEESFIEETNDAATV